jgi:hypothetical protein
MMACRPPTDQQMPAHVSSTITTKTSAVSLVTHHRNNPMGISERETVAAPSSDNSIVLSHQQPHCVAQKNSSARRDMHPYKPLGRKDPERGGGDGNTIGETRHAGANEPDRSGPSRVQQTIWDHRMVSTRRCSGTLRFRTPIAINTLCDEMLARLEIQRDLSWVDGALENWLRVSAGHLARNRLAIQVHFFIDNFLGVVVSSTRLT